MYTPPCDFDNEGYFGLQSNGFLNENQFPDRRFSYTDLLSEPSISSSDYGSPMSNGFVDEPEIYYSAPTAMMSSWIDLSSTYPTPDMVFATDYFALNLPTFYNAASPSSYPATPLSTGVGFGSVEMAKRSEEPHITINSSSDSNCCSSTTSRLSSPSCTPTPKKKTSARSRGRRVSSNQIIGLKTFQCTHDGCGKIFKRSEHLKRHVRSIHTKEKPFECPYNTCGKRFSRSDNLNQHIRIHRFVGKRRGHKKSGGS
ncbi:hypothetical protein DFQ28_006955 [Apophysomyces sp. BC1034]|nr:hypothetical protein DFQ29_008343 [Apophysomyces sp. BC1021]KAG0187036.1 hypothetical protein DFQ28_006955 [Apophysomyces sp. BC1034]